MIQVRRPDDSKLFQDRFQNLQADLVQGDVIFSAMQFTAKTGGAEQLRAYTMQATRLGAVAEGSGRWS